MRVRNRHLSNFIGIQKCVRASGQFWSGLSRSSSHHRSLPGLRTRCVITRTLAARTRPPPRYFIEGQTIWVEWKLLLIEFWCACRRTLELYDLIEPTAIQEKSLIHIRVKPIIISMLYFFVFLFIRDRDRRHTLAGSQSGFYGLVIPRFSRFAPPFWKIFDPILQKCCAQDKETCCLPPSRDSQYKFSSGASSYRTCSMFWPEKFLFL